MCAGFFCFAGIVVTIVIPIKYMAALGQQLITNLLADPINKSNPKCKKGVYTEPRNYKIACRFYYHFYIKGLRYEVSLERLNHEFDISELRLAQLIMQSRDYLADLKDKKADQKLLQKKYPYFNWY